MLKLHIVIIAGDYTFKLISFNVSLACILWMGIPGILNLFKILLEQQIQDSNSHNVTSSDKKAYKIAEYGSLSLEMASVAFVPVALGQLFHGFEKLKSIVVRLPMFQYLCVLLVSKGCLLVGFSFWIILSIYQISEYTLIIYLIHNIVHGVHGGSYLFLSFVNMFLPGCLMTGIINNCINTHKTTSISEIKQLLKEILNTFEMGLIYLSSKYKNYQTEFFSE